MIITDNISECTICYWDSFIQIINFMHLVIDFYGKQEGVSKVIYGIKVIYKSIQM